MKITRWVVAAVASAALAACQHAAPHGTLPPTAGAAGSATLEDRMARLEAAYAKNAEALEFLRKVYDQQKAQQAEAERDEPADDAVFAVAIADAVAAGRVDGPPTAAVTIVKAFDFACPYCQRVSSTIDELVKDYAGKVRVVYLNMLIHPEAKPAHLASCAAAKQGRYQQFRTAFWDKGYGQYVATKDPSMIDETHVVAIARGVGLDTARLKTDMAGAACADQLKHDMDELAAFHVNSTPTFFINGKQISGALPKDQFHQLIDEQLAIVARSGVPAASYYDQVVLATGEKQFRSKLDPKPAAR